MDAEKKVCPECGREISSATGECEHCRGEKRTSSRQSRERWVVVGVLVVIVIYGAVAAVKDIVTRRKNQTCVDNLKQISQALYMYAENNRDEYPPIDSTKNNFMFDADRIYPTYVSDLSLLRCPWDTDHTPANTEGSAGDESRAPITDDSYVYLGWMVMSDDEAEEFFEAYDKLDPDDYHSNITVPEGKGNAGGPVLHRLSMGVDRFLITDINTIGSRESGASIVPVIWDRLSTISNPSDHRRRSERGGHVLYLDGHVEFVKYSDFPMTETMARMLEERDSSADGGLRMDPHRREERR